MCVCVGILTTYIAASIPFCLSITMYSGEPGYSHTGLDQLVGKGLISSPMALKKYIVSI